MNNNKISKNYLIYTPDYYPVVGGAEVFAYEYVKFISKIVGRVTVITRLPTKASRLLNNISKQPIYTKDNNIEIYRAPYLEIKYIRVLSSIFITYIFFIFVILKNKYSYIHFIGFYPSAIIWRLTKCLFRNKITIYTEQGMLIDVIRKNKNIYSSSPAFLKNCANEFFASCNLITCVSPAIKERLLEINSNLKVNVIPNGIYTQNQVYSSKDEIRIISTSRLVQKNNIPSLVKSIPLVLNRYKGNKKITLDIIGDGEEREIIQRIINQNNLEDNVTIHGTLCKEEVEEMYKKSLLFCRLSLSEGFGISFIEALGWGLPIIGSEIIGNMDYFSDSFGRVVKDINDDEEISNAILYYLNDEKIHRNASNAAIEASKIYDWKIINQRYFNVIFNRA